MGLRTQGGSEEVKSGVGKEMNNPTKERKAKYWVMSFGHLPPNGAGITGAHLAGFSAWKKAKAYAHKMAKKEEEEFVIIAIIEIVESPIAQED